MKRTVERLGEFILNIIRWNDFFYVYLKRTLKQRDMEIIGIINYNTWDKSKPKFLYVFSQTLNFYYASYNKDGSKQMGYAKRDYPVLYNYDPTK